VAAHCHHEKRPNHRSAAFRAATDFLEPCGTSRTVAEKEAVTTNLERISPWWDRQVPAGLAVAAAAAVAAVFALSEVTVWKVSAVLGLLCVVIWVARMQTVPFVGVSGSTLVMRNLDRRYGIPWQAVRGLDREPRAAVLSLDPTDGRRVLVHAFSRRPSFGRHKKVTQTLERHRDVAARATDEAGAGAEAGTVRETQRTGIAGFLLALPFGVTLVMLHVEGVLAVLN
jgi:hypothetical protein